MENIAEILSDIKNKKAANNEVVDDVSQISPKAIRALDEKYGWHSKVTNYAIYVLCIYVAILTGLTFTGYFRLEEKIVNESHFLTQSIIDMQHSTEQRLDEEKLSTTQRLDEESRFTTQRIDAFVNGQPKETPLQKNSNIK